MKFLLDKRCGDEPLRDAFLSLFTLAILKDALVREVGGQSTSGGC